MCGIVGVLHFDGAEVEPSKIRLMTDFIAHRGPDGEGCWIDGSVGLGHRRLSIIDLNERASQPMVSYDGSSVITYNGEIYNYKELSIILEKKGLPSRTSSDTEVILNLYKIYGVKCLDYLRGMFAFAIWDKNKKCLFIARDRVGIKPLYFLKNENLFVFASEIKAITGGGYSTLKINFQAFAHYLRFLVVSQPETIFEDIHKLSPGHYIVVDYSRRKLLEKVYWKLDENTFCQDHRSESELVAKLELLLEDSVKYHMVADVPVSAFLSGGLDSSAVVSMMRQAAPQQRLATFSTVFPGEGDFDESRYANIVSRLHKTKHVTNTIDENFLDDYSDIAWALDEPFAISSAYATYYLARSVATETKVVLTGDGGDELFAGYSGYANNNYLQGTSFGLFVDGIYNLLFFMAKNLRLKNTGLSRVLVALRRRSGSEGLRYSEQVAQNSLYAVSQIFENDFFLDCMALWPNNLMALYYNQLGSIDKLSKKLYAEYRTRLVDEMLMKVDRMTMAHSLEARVPLLDHQIVEFAFGLPSAIKQKQVGSEIVSKYILKEAMRKHLPEEIIFRRKQGFNIPVRNWLLKGRFLDTVKESLMEGQLLKWGVISETGINFLLRQQTNTNHNFNNMLMLLFAFETWAGVYDHRVGSVSL
ncbi:MAG: asparagine synthase (glutamine-hydrolyzing) [Clostridiales bacterium]|nr:asparagine synthase (glutamine-hydrolyzing) [Clostridiales bacterium]